MTYKLVISERAEDQIDNIIGYVAVELSNPTAAKAIIDDTANYEEDSELDNLIKSIIDKTAATEVLENNYQTQRLEVAEFDDSDNALRKANKRLDLILNLERSHSFRNTHLVIEDLREVDAWDDSEIEMLCEIATENRQVKGVIKDTDVRAL